MPITNFDKVELLLPMTGANNGTVFTDYSLRQRTVTRAGAVTSTAQSKFAAYGSSGLFNGSTDWLQIAASDGLNIATGDWYVGFYARPAQVAAAKYFWSLRDVASVDTLGIQVTQPGADPTKVRLAVGDTDASAWEVEITSTNSIAVDNWYHIAVNRSGSTFRLFLDGVIQGSATWAGTIAVGGQPLVIADGRVTGGALLPWSGHMQDFVFVKGDAVHTANFTPPARMTQRELTRTNTGTDSHEFDRAVLFDFNGGDHTGRHRTVLPDSSGDFVADDLIDLEYGVAFIKDGCGPECRGPVLVDPDT
jgi:hypothetical protein